METCASCGARLSEAEPAHVWNDSVVCGRCRAAVERRERGQLPTSPPAIPSVPRKPLSGGKIAAIVIASTAGMCILFGLVGGREARREPEPTVAKGPVGFSAWDGSHVELVREVKNRLHDPSSFEHVRTKYGDQGGHYLVIMEYRAKNGFGAIRLESVAAECGKHGKFLRFVE